MSDERGVRRYSRAAGGWGSVRGMAETLLREMDSPAIAKTLSRQNKPGGFMCTSCAWAKPAKPHTFEFCENGAKATMWELTSRRCTPETLAAHRLASLRSWPDHDLEQLGRLTHPMRYDAAGDIYVPCGWDEAFRAIGGELRAMDPKSTVFYASGHASLETSYLYALFARMYGHNNLPDSSNMCHETTSVALKQLIGSPVGTVVLDDFKTCDAIFFFGQNTGSNSPRFLHILQECARRGVKIVTFDPLREKGLEEFTNPQEPVQMLAGKSTRISRQYYQVRPGGDIAAILGMCRHILEEDARRSKAGEGSIIDHAFICEHTTGFGAFAHKALATSWEAIEEESGLPREAIQAAAEVYIAADRTIGIYGMGLTQHVHGFENVACLLNLLLLKGNIGRPGTGISPVRGHSNVQGQRTVGITEKPELAPNEKYRTLFAFEPPMDKGYGTVETCEKVLAGEISAFLALGGNFLRAIPEQKAMEAAWPRIRLTVSIATKLNRSHLFPGSIAYLLPCLGRAEEDVQSGGSQTVTMEDSLSCIHGSRATHAPASPDLRSEVAIVAGLAQATLPPNPHADWAGWVQDYGRIRDVIEATFPEIFKDFNDRLFTPGGFYKGNAARERIWQTEAGKARFTAPDTLSAFGVPQVAGRYRLITLRSNDQFNTTIYGYSDRLRGIEGRRDVLLISPREMARAGLREGQRVALVSDADDGTDREVGGLSVVPFDLPDGCVASYYPEMNPLVPLWYHDIQSKTPASKAVPVRIRA